MEFVDEAEAVKSLVGAIALQAISDWKALNYGENVNVRWAGQTVWRKEVYGFLVSSEFASMVNFVSPGIDMRAVDDKLQLTKEWIQTVVMEELVPEEREVITLLADNSINITRAAEVGNYSRSMFVRRIRDIKDKTGVDPTDFWGLTRLLKLLEIGVDI